MLITLFVVLIAKLINEGEYYLVASLIIGLFWEREKLRELFWEGDKDKKEGGE
jgi:hypothetical protein